MGRLGWIVPTRGRPHAVDRLHGAWVATRGWEDADLILLVDGDDPHRDEYIDQARHSHAMVFDAGARQPLVPKLNRAAVRLADEGYAALGFGGDDHVPRTYRWACTYLETLADLGTGIVYGDDLHRGEDLPTQWAMTVDIIQALGRMVPAPVAHQFCDRAVLDLGRHAGCIRYLPDVVVEHCHYAVGKAPKDNTYLLGNREAVFQADQATYLQWVADGLDQDAAAVRALRTITA